MGMSLNGYQAEQPNQYSASASTILDPRRMNNHSKNKSHCIYRDVLLAPLGLLACIETALPPFPALLTERESMVATDGSPPFRV